MRFERLNMEEEAAESFAGLMKQAKKCVELYRRAQMALPEPLQRMVGTEGHGAGQSVAIGEVPNLIPRGIGVDADWICIDTKKATPTSIVLAVLRSAAAPMKINEVAAGVGSIRLGISQGVINNIGTRLDGSVIARSEAGWQLIKYERAPTLRGDRICGPFAIFTPREIAAHRRDVILLLLREVEDGLTIRQLIHILKNSNFVHPSVGRHLIEDDVQALSHAGLIGRRDSHKWAVLPASPNPGS
jgi:hypothetical protein